MFLINLFMKRYCWCKKKIEKSWTSDFLLLLFRLKYVRLDTKAPAPRLISAWFDKMYCSLTIMFDVPVEGQKSCRHLFDDSSFHKVGQSK